MPPRVRPLALLLALAPACSDGGNAAGDGTDGGTGDPSPGAALYENPIDDGNSFACASCHALSEPAPDGLRRPGHPIGDAHARPSFKNGQVSELREAVNSCLTEWMNAEPWTASDPRWLDLEAFLADQAPASAPALSFEIVDPPADLSGGDPDVGLATFNQTCSVCHGTDGTGTTRAPPVAGQGQDPAYVASRVRRSGRVDSSVYDGLEGGIMPFWASDRLSDDELRDIVAWLALEDDGGTTGATGTTGTTGDGGSGTTSGGGTGGTSDSGGDPTTGSGCSADHPRVGWVADLSMLFHDVGGTAEIVDDCTVVISDFTYDGTGIDVRIYGGVNGDYDNGFAMTDDLLKPGGYTNEVLVASVPDGQTLDDLDGISVWCVDVGVSFGDGMFAPP